MNLNSLARKAAKGSAPAAYGGAMTPEDLIRFVLFHKEAAAMEISRLQKQHGWLTEGLLSDGSRVVPFGRWAEACIAFGSGGVAGLRPLLLDAERAVFAVGILEHVRTEESVLALAEVCARGSWLSSDPQQLDWKAMGAINGLLSFEDYVQVRPSVLEQLGVIIRRAFASAPTSFLQGFCILTMRGLPSDASLKWVENITSTDEFLIRTRKTAIKTLVARCSPDHRPLDAEQKLHVRRLRALDV